jgi:hypothetical protein
MKYKFNVLSIALLFIIPSYAQIPDSDIWLLDIKDSAGQIIFSNPQNITHRKGYDNQPCFSPDGKYLLFTSDRTDLKQMDTYKYDLITKKISPITHTPTSEYSPTFMPDGKNISVVMVEKDSTQRLWMYSLAGDKPACILPKIDSIGYHCWMNKDTLAVFIITEPVATLQMVNIHTQKITPIADSIGRCLRFFNKGLWYAVKKGHFYHLYSYSPPTHTNQLQGIIESEDYCLTPKNETWSFSDLTIVAGYMNSKTGAPEIIDLEKWGINKPSRINISPDRKHIAVVSNN